MVSESRARSVRRSDAVRNIKASPARLLQALRQRVGWPSMVVAVVLVAGVVVVSLTEQDRLPYRVGQRTDQPIVARVEFSRINQTDTEQQRQKARLATPNSYRFNQALADAVRSQFRDLQTAIEGADSLEKLKADGVDRWNLDEAAFVALGSMKGPGFAAALDKLLTDIDAALHASTLVAEPKRPSEAERGVPSTADHAIFIDDRASPRVVSFEQVKYFTPQRVEELAAAVAARKTIPPAIKPVVKRILQQTMVASDPAKHAPQTPYSFDKSRTLADLAAADNLPVVYETFRKGTILVPPGEITGEHFALLADEHEHFLQARRSDPDLRGPWMQARVGRVALMLLLVLAAMRYTLLFQSRAVHNYARAIALAGLVLGVLVADRALDAINVSASWTVTTLTIAGAVLTFAYNQRFALGLGAILAFMTMVLLQQSPGHLFIDIAALSTTILMLGEVRTRLRLVLIGLTTGTVTAIVALLAGLVELKFAPAAWLQAGVAGAAATLGVCFVLIMLPLIERAFRIVTPLTLLEWADTSQPLLRQLIQKAPGTWQHSHLLANMGEAAAEEIGANGLLVRVGALYHDIGKLSKPEYFVENQQSQANAHAKLAPTMSMLVILGHVKDGLALAREYRLPPALQRFIAEHHGTTVVKYFHAMATHQHAARGGDPTDVNESEFRYPGPKPSTKETAILMLCDGVEGAVRALQDPTPGRIEDVVHSVVMGRLMDGQLDACDMTLKDLHRIEQSLVKSLNAIYHGRIAYPKPAESRSAVAQPA